MTNNFPHSSFTIEQMHAYLTGTSTEKVNMAIEKAVASDKDLVLALEEMDKAIEAGVTLDEMVSRRTAFSKSIRLKSQDIGDIKSTTATKIPIRKTRFPFLKIAAAVLILVVGGTFIFRSFQVSEPKIGDYLEPYGNQLTLRSNSVKSDFQDGMDAYDAGDYRSAVASLNNHLRTAPKDSGARLYLGISYLLLGDSDQALKNFDELSNNSDHPFRNALSWYRSLALWQMGSTLEATDELYKITGHPNPFRNQAKKLQSKLIR